MAVDVSTICAELEGLAAIFNAFSSTTEAAGFAGVRVEEVDVYDPVTAARYKEPRIIYRTLLDGCRIKLVIAPTGEAILARAEALKKTARKMGAGTTENFRECRRAANWKPSLSRPKRSSTVAQQFLDDGEKENWRAYDELFKP
jgi:hypothetical protein